MRFFYILFTALIVFGNNNLFAGEPAPVFPEVNLTGKITDSLINYLPGEKTTLFVRVSKYPFTENNSERALNTTYRLELKHNEKFHLKLSSPAERFYVSIKYVSPQAPINDNNWSSSDNVYILQAGDDLQALLGKDFYEFSGRGAEKLNCESEIYKLAYRYSDEDLKIFDEDYKKFIDVTNRKKDSCLVLQEKLTQSYAPQLGPDLTQVMHITCKGLRYYSMLRDYFFYSVHYPGFYEAFISTEAYRQIKTFSGDTILQSKLAQSPVYADFLFEKIKLDNFAIKDQRTQYSIILPKVYSTIKNYYTGSLRDKLLSLFFMNFSKFPLSDSYLDESAALCGKSIYKDILINLQETKSKGLPFYPFELPNTKGHLVKLSDFKDKVVIIDFWYTGCENCLVLHNLMKVVHEKYSSDPRIVFVNISIDKNKDNWLKSVATSRYTNPKDVNLYTEGKGVEHPLLRKYLIEGFPTEFILKNGKIFSSNPPFPNGKTINDGGTKDLIDLVNSALEEN